MGQCTNTNKSKTQGRIAGHLPEDTTERIWHRREGEHSLNTQVVGETMRRR